MTGDWCVWLCEIFLQANVGQGILAKDGLE